MKGRNLKKVLNAGKSSLEKESTQVTVMIIAIIVDAVLFYTALEGAINENWRLNLVVTIGACIAIDMSPLLISKLVFSSIDMKVKKTSIIALLIVLSFAFAGMFAIRWATRASLNGGSLGLFNDSVSSASLDVVAFVLGYLPIMTSCVIFIMGILAFDKDRKTNGLLIALIESKARESEYQRKLDEFGNEENRKDRMNNYVKTMAELNNKEIDRTEELNNCVFDKLLAEKINAKAEQITTIMEEE